MAIVCCPECGEKISDTSKKCIHCGCEVKFCKECKHAWVGESSICSECGYEIKDTSIYSFKPNLNLNDAKEVHTAWKNGSYIRKYFGNYMVCIALLVISFIFFIVGMIKLFTWGDGLEELLTYEDTISSINALIIFWAIFYVSSNIYSWTYESVIYNSISTWMKYRKIDGKEIIGQTANIDFNSMPLEETLSYCNATYILIAAETSKNNEILKNKQKNTAIIVTCLAFFFSLFLCVFVLSNVKEYIGIKIFKFDTSFNFSSIVNWWALILSIVIYVIKLIYCKACEKKEKETHIEWIKKEFPEQHNKIEYLLSAIDRYVEKITEN